MHLVTNPLSLQAVPGDAAHLHPSQLPEEQEKKSPDERLPSEDMIFVS